jgi:hypothetical protein
MTLGDLRLVNELPEGGQVGRRLGPMNGIDD